MRIKIGGVVSHDAIKHPNDLKDALKPIKRI